MTCQVSDGIDVDTETFNITVNNVNRPPVLNPIANITVDEGITVVLNPTAIDPDDDTLTFSYSGWMISESRNTAVGDAGVYLVTVTVSDGLLTDSQNVTITVNGSGNQLIVSNLTVSTNKVYEVIDNGLRNRAKRES